MTKRYSQEFHQFVAANVAGRTTKELVALVNSKFGIQMTESAMKCYKTNQHLKSGTPTGHRTGEATKQFPEPVRNYIFENYKGTGHTAMAEALNAQFGTAYTASRIKGFYGNHKLDSGLNGQFHQGHVPANKGKKGVSYPGMEATQFKKGQAPHNYRPVGSERVNVDGYTEVKTADPKTWRPKHILIWESANGPVPKGYAVLFGDGDKTNIQLENLILVSRKQLVRLNQNGLIQNNVDLTRSAILVTDIISRCSERQKKIKKPR